jgi:hypothetical protein
LQIFNAQQYFFIIQLFLYHLMYAIGGRAGPSKHLPES